MSAVRQQQRKSPIEDYGTSMSRTLTTSRLHCLAAVFRRGAIPLIQRAAAKQWSEEAE
jgi:hypothetical protein